MSSLSDAHPMQQPVPDGYRLPKLWETVGFAYACETCGAAVMQSAVELHQQWHQANR